MTSDPIVPATEERVSILAVWLSGGYLKLRNELQSLDMDTSFVERIEQFGQLVRNGQTYDVALLPASLPDMDWWSVWGELALLDQRPAILVYTHTSSFNLWSGVLEAGCYDVLAAPFTHERVEESLLRAARSFQQQRFPRTEE